ncbi:MAG: indole-3-glycerol phosphate synthase TrpC [Anaerolineales bacterium]
MKQNQISTRPSILEEIFAHKQREVELRKSMLPLGKLKEMAASVAAPPDFCKNLRRAKEIYSTPALIAEVKYASPSKGNFGISLSPLEMAGQYINNGAAAVSVLTDETYFHGHLDYLMTIAAHFPQVPVLRKDFIFDPYQIYESRAAGASAVLLIAGMLSQADLCALQHLCHEMGLTALVEVHDREELQKALACHPRAIGINNRNLNDFSVNIATCMELRPLILQEIFTVAESGITTAEEVHLLKNAGFDAMLVGEALVNSGNIGKKVRELLDSQEKR